VGTFDGLVGPLAISPNGKYLAASGKLRESPTKILVPIWDLSTGTKLTALSAHGWQVDDLVFSADGATLAAMVTNGPSDDHVLVWNINEEHLISKQQFTDARLGAIGYDVDRREFLVIESSGDDLVIYDVITGDKVSAMTFTTDSYITYDFDNSGTRLAVGLRSGAVNVYDVRTGRRIHTFIVPLDEAVSAVAFSRDGTKLAAGTSAIPSTIAVWHLPRTTDTRENAK
jgi:WD40 repeat protein